MQQALMIMLIASVILSYVLKKGWIAKIALSAVLLMALLVVWALTGVKALIFNAYEDLILFAASFYGIALLIEDYKSN